MDQKRLLEAGTGKTDERRCIPQDPGADLDKGSAAMILERGVSTRTSGSQDIFLPKVLIDLKGCSSIQAIVDDRSILF